MKLYILRPQHDLPEDDNPWEPWFDKCFGLVVRAKDEKQARELAHERGMDENRGEFAGKKIAFTKSPWLDEKYSTCTELHEDGEAKVIIQDIMHA